MSSQESRPRFAHLVVSWVALFIGASLAAAILGRAISSGEMSSIILGAILMVMMLLATGIVVSVTARRMRRRR